jgi:hypothetical protein
MDSNILSKIIEKYNEEENELANSFYQSGGCIIFANTISKFLQDNDVYNFDIGQYVSFDESDRVDGIIHQYIIYEDRIFDSVCFGEYSLDKINDEFYIQPGLYGEHITEMPVVIDSNTYIDEILYYELERIFNNINEHDMASLS